MTYEELKARYDAMCYAYDLQQMLLAKAEAEIKRLKDGTLPST